ncbi:hypothetical protein TBLA_0B09030 [Henningerozyma blattae CBS 6284]|uniref:Phosphoglycerate mutase n=1 Tax=Henningerozyma blattae (strain ATCC 34711 / CBS 6284 / DSM 70876 / NBRC 10599 / NRRL Y-10934 / UCD 77-7) TaxID=1071380 RepID=I2H016_HENB6|nr:hypothetical protein TBLA_0B09030 [Tetrapisispora blattae CBS 6284]CCH59718.1 hypothetical protein TBLA_0B09030 [Tetrapisispora blattae CBS 6284]
MQFKALPGFFKAYEEQNSKPIDSSKEDHLKFVHHKTWKDLYKSIPHNSSDIEYKLIILGRHGQGYHNAAIDRYGMDAWNKHWSLLDGDEYGEWLDSRLTPLGKKQVSRTGKEVLLPMVKGLGKYPDVYFSSPMRRCLETYVGSWGQVYKMVENDQKKLEITIIENLRETLGEHTCDKRVLHSEVISEYQNSKMESGHIAHWNYPKGYPEEDQLWFADWRETNEEMDVRVRSGLEELFSQVKSDERIVSLTCHSGVIDSVLRNLDHPAVENLDVGKSVIAVVALRR